MLDDERRFDPDGLPRRSLFGLHLLDLPDLEPLVDVLTDVPVVADNRPSVVVTPNVDHVVHLHKGSDAATAAVVRAARWVLPDGQPLVWASRLARRPLRGRLTGSDLTAALWPRLVASNRSVVVVASSEEVAAQVRADAPTAVVLTAPMLRGDPRRTQAFVDLVVAAIDGHRASHVFVGLGRPSQYHVIQGVLESRPPDDDHAPVLLAIGASFEMYYGFVERAPEWMRRHGVEWLYRFLREPRRLFRRYFVDGATFLPIAIREIRSARRATGRRRSRPPRGSRRTPDQGSTGRPTGP